ncbi:MAG: hypothetical protein ACLR7D_17345 [Lachnospira eligens]
MVKKEAKQVSIIVMRPDNGEILAMANVPEYKYSILRMSLIMEPDEEERRRRIKMDLLNQHVAEFLCINDTYRPGLNI